MTDGLALREYDSDSWLRRRLGEALLFRARRPPQESKKDRQEPPIKEGYENAGIRSELKTVHQIKVHDLNFYPTKGIIFRDGDPGALEQEGLDAFIRLLKPKSRHRHAAEDENLKPATEIFIEGP